MKTLSTSTGNVHLVLSESDLAALLADGGKPRRARETDGNKVMLAMEGGSHDGVTALANGPGNAWVLIGTGALEALAGKDGHREISTNGTKVSVEPDKGHYLPQASPYVTYGGFRF